MFLQQAFLDENKEVLIKARQKLQERAKKMLTPMVKRRELYVGDSVRIAATTIEQ